MTRTRSTLYRWARILGEVEAAEKGPGPLAKRLVRKRVYRVEGRTTRRWLRKFGL